MPPQEHRVLSGQASNRAGKLGLKMPAREEVTYFVGKTPQEAANKLLSDGLGCARLFRSPPVAGGFTETANKPEGASRLIP